MKILILLTIATILVATIRADEVATDEHRIRNLSIFSPDVARYAKSVKATKGTKGQKAPKMPKASKAPKAPKVPSSPDITMAPTMAPVAVQEEDDDSNPTNREQFCENNGFSEAECNILGDCCQYDTGMNECFADNDSMTCAIDNDDDTNNDDEDFDFIPTDRERYCEMQGFSEEECNNRDDCCQYDAFENECFADNALTTCAFSGSDDDMDPPTFDDDFTISDDDDFYYNPGTNRDILCGGFDFGGLSEEECNNFPGDCCQYDSTENLCFGNSDSMTCDVKQLVCESPPDDPEMPIETNCAGLNMFWGDCCQYDSTENKCLVKSDPMACIFAPTDAPTQAPTMDQTS